jgi:membrane associated rhomboid family serine protease
MISTNLIIIALTVLASIYAWNNQNIYSKWIFHPYQIKKNKEYHRFITSGFIHADYIHLLFNMFSLYAIGGGLEDFFTFQFGTSSQLYYWALYLGAMVAADLPTFFKEKNNTNYRALGASGAVSAVVFAFIILAPTTTLSINFIPMPAFLFGVLYLGISYYQSGRAADNVNHDAHFYGAMFGIVFMAVLVPESIPNFIQQISNWSLFS